MSAALLGQVPYSMHVLVCDDAKSPCVTSSSTPHKERGKRGDDQSVKCSAYAWTSRVTGGEDDDFCDRKSHAE